jgi:hypothetical protein
MTTLLNWTDGITTLIASWANGVVQSCQGLSILRGFNGNGGAQQVYPQGQNTPGDGGGGEFYWNASASGVTDDNLNTIVPSGSLQGCWSRINNNVELTQTVTSGSSVQLSTPVRVLFVNLPQVFGVTLPSSPLLGEVHKIKDSGGYANTYPITITASIDGASSYVINTAYGCVTLQYNGFGWSVV